MTTNSVHDSDAAAARAAEVASRIDETWPDEAARERIRRALFTYGEDPGEREPERVRLAILKLADGREDSIARFVRDAKRDYRDVLMWAEYPREGAALWSLRKNLSPEEEARLAELRRADRQEMENWRRKS